MRSSRYYKIIFISYLLIISSYVHIAYANPQLSTILDDQSLVNFYYRAGDINTIERSDLYFFSTPDCSAGFLAHYQTEEYFPIHVNQFFSLLKNNIYQAGQSLIPTNQLPQIHSILIQFKGPQQTMPIFISACADQKINCCIQIKCNIINETCEPIHVLPTQAFILFKQLIEST